MRNEAELREDIAKARKIQEDAERSWEADMGMLMRVLTDYWEMGDIVTATPLVPQAPGPFTLPYRGTDSSRIRLLDSAFPVELYRFENHTFNERGLPR